MLVQVAQTKKDQTSFNPNSWSHVTIVGIILFAIGTCICESCCLCSDCGYKHFRRYRTRRAAKDHQTIQHLNKSGLSSNIPVLNHLMSTVEQRTRPPSTTTPNVEQQPLSSAEIGKLVYYIQQKQQKPLESLNKSVQATAPIFHKTQSLTTLAQNYGY
ncbi:unnamed protein product [Didymodactylos carnosus]|uniref:Uncharacterized protein n=1 Tax=Didymodactylos carnosus TaxID=1234261 RepID=A0A8S2D9C6_9BILA|nr:unnamed protein product [Didymodactylos carnosus]CAF3654030.1 unnamed protein product [Didymodactylos carnosus]